MESSFDSLNIKDEILRGVYSYGFEKPSQIQSQSIPHLVSRKMYRCPNSIGYGKDEGLYDWTALSIDEDEASIQVLILTPTKEAN